MRRIALLAVVAALGLAAAIGYTAKPAQAWDIGSLPAPYIVGVQIDLTGSPCHSFYIVTWYDQSVKIGFGDDGYPNYADCNPAFQHDLDAFVDATINQTPPVTTAPPTTMTTTAATTTAPTTTAAPPAPTTTDAAVTTSPAATTTVTQTVTTVIVDPTIDQRLADLETKYAALAARVDAIAKANTASWDAFISVVESGGTVDEAALAARSAGLNAIYLLG